jgi:hypothetical protein
MEISGNKEKLIDVITKFLIFFSSSWIIRSQEFTFYSRFYRHKDLKICLSHLSDRKFSQSEKEGNRRIEWAVILTGIS